MIDIKNGPTRIEVKRHELKPPVRKYAENLEAQIREFFPKTGHPNSQTFFQTGSTTEVKSLHALMAELDQTVAENRIPLENPFDEEKFFENLLDFVHGWEYARVNEMNDVQNVRENDIRTQGKGIRYLDSESQFRLIPGELLLKDSTILQRILEEVAKHTRAERNYGDMGLLISSLYNAAIQKIPEAQRARVIQEMDLAPVTSPQKEKIRYLAFEHPGGTLKIAGQAGSGTAFAMTGGQVVMETVGIDAGVYMKGGVLNVKKADRRLGFKMQEGASIIAEEASNYAGLEMSGGSLKIDSAGSGLGKEMTGGRIEVRIAGNDTGVYMKNGEIIVSEATGDDLGGYMTGGKIQAYKAGQLVGMKQSGGIIIVAHAGKFVGEDKIAGEIFITESAESINAKSDRGNTYLKGVKQ